MLQRQEIGLGKEKMHYYLEHFNSGVACILADLLKKELDMICKQILLRNLLEQTNYVRVIE